MPEFRKNVILLSLTAAFAAGLLAGCAEKRADPPSPAESRTEAPAAAASPEAAVTKADIERKLEKDPAGIQNAVWAPDASAVVFTRKGGDASNVCIWKVNHKRELVVCAEETTPRAYLWSPDSKYFLIEIGRASQRTIVSSIIEAKTLKSVGDNVTSVDVSAPIWSPDSKYLALSTMDESTETIRLDIYARLSRTTVAAVTGTGARGPYIVEYWKNGAIGYTEVTARGERAEQTVKIGA